MESNTKRKKIVLRLEQETYRTLCRLAKEDGIPKSKLLSQRLQKQLPIITSYNLGIFKKAISFQFYIDNDIYRYIFEKSCEYKVPVSEIIRSQISESNDLISTKPIYTSSKIINFWNKGRINSVIEEFELNGAQTLYEYFIISYSYYSLAEFSKSCEVFDLIQYNSDYDKKILFLFKYIMKMYSKSFLNLATISDVYSLREFELFIKTANNLLLSGLYFTVIGSIYDELDYNDFALTNLNNALIQFSKANEVNLMAEIYSKMAKNSTRILDLELTVKYIKQIFRLLGIHQSISIQNIISYQKILLEYGFDKNLSSFIPRLESINLQTCFLGKLARYRYEVVRIANMLKNKQDISKKEIKKLKSFTGTFEGNLFYDYIEMFDLLNQKKLKNLDSVNYFSNLYETSKTTGRNNFVINYFKNITDYNSENQIKVENSRINLIELSHSVKSPIIARAASLTLVTKQFAAVR